MDRAMSIIAGIPNGSTDKVPAIEPVRDHPHLFLRMAKTPPIKASIPTTIDIIGTPKIMLGTNGGISPLPSPVTPLRPTA